MRNLIGHYYLQYDKQVDVDRGVAISFYSYQPRIQGEFKVNSILNCLTTEISQKPTRSYIIYLSTMFLSRDIVLKRVKMAKKGLSNTKFVSLW